jgi:hypothetical protein
VQWLRDRRLARSLLLVDVAHEARNAGLEDREAAESDLSEALRAALADADEVHQLRSDPSMAPLLESWRPTAARSSSPGPSRTTWSPPRVRCGDAAGSGGCVSRDGPLPVTVDLDDQPPAALVDG